MSSNGVTCGGLLLRPGDPARDRWQRSLALTNPAYLQYLRYPRGKQPPKTLHPLVTQDGGPWAGGVVVPRFAPGVDGVDRTVAPEADVLTFRGELRDYQAEAVDAAVAQGHGVVVAPTGAGKTVIGCGLMARYPTNAIVLVHTRDLAEQWVERIESFLGVEATLVGYGKKWPERPGRVTVASLQTLARKDWWTLHEWSAGVGVVVQDEAHHSPARTYVGVLAGLRARHKFGLTATPEREDGFTPWMHWTLGPTVAEIDHRVLEERGAVLRPTVRVWHAPEVDLEGLEAHERARALAEDPTRNGGLCIETMLLTSAGHVVLLLCRLVDHARTLAEQLADKGIDACALVGEMKAAERAEALERLRAGSVQVVCATSLADEGLDAPRVSAVVLVHPTQNIGRTLQRIGRALRPAAGAPDPVVLDVVDSFGAYQGYSRKRHSTYVRRGWVVQYTGRSTIRLTR